MERSSAVRQSRASDAITTVPALSVLSSTWQRLSMPPRGSVDVGKLHLRARHQGLQPAQGKAHARDGQLAHRGGVGIAGFDDDLHERFSGE
jgi:hypothetical protein